MEVLERVEMELKKTNTLLEEMLLQMKVNFAASVQEENEKKETLRSMMESARSFLENSPMNPFASMLIPESAPVHKRKKRALAAALEADVEDLSEQLQGKEEEEE